MSLFTLLCSNIIKRKQAEIQLQCRAGCRTHRGEPTNLEGTQTRHTLNGAISLRAEFQSPARNEFNFREQNGAPIKREINTLLVGGLQYEQVESEQAY